ncbi:MAG: VanZ family protein [Alphaproteobacteria bacterium]
MSSSSRVRLLARIVFAIGAVVVLVGSLTPAADMPEIGVSDKLQHFGAYAALAFVAVLAWPSRQPLGLVLIGLAVAGPVIELLQLLVPGRSASVVDAVADVVGVTVGAAIALVIRSRLSRGRDDAVSDPRR